MLKQRLITAAILIPLVVWIILALPTQYFAVIFAVVAIVGASEWSRLANIPPGVKRGLYSATLVLVMGLLWPLHAFSNVSPLVILGSASLWWLVIFLMVINFPKGKLLESAGFKAVTGFWLLVPCWVALISLHSKEQSGPEYVLFLLTLIWVADSAAYFVGRQWGNKKMAPNVSPGKTMAGLWGAVLGGALWSILGVMLLAPSQSIGFVLLCMVTVLFSVLGDLAESMFKRHAGVKDSGNVLPGHGGVLDRIDSVTAAAPVFVFGLLILESGL